ncbi:hypothetical protein BDR03DRAFT_964450 [Suillus americanus]|nr:hypothetical protein BDR03DRAFT_964450 [Suillus americanus]
MHDKSSPLVFPSPPFFGNVRISSLFCVPHIVFAFLKIDLVSGFGTLFGSFLSVHSVRLHFTL